jgi:hypothetical protein
LGCRLDQSNGREEGKGRKGDIYQKTPDQRSRAFPQREKAFEGKQQRKKCDSDQRCGKDIQVAPPARRQTTPHGVTNSIARVISGFTLMVLTRRGY